jgi:F-type H+-transporting ATPase subunit b
MNLIDWRLVGTQIIGFLLTVWLVRRFAWAPLLKVLEERRQRIAAQFQEAERQQAEAAALKARMDQELRGIEAQARKRLQEAVAEGQRVAGEIRTQAQQEATQRIGRAEDEIAREREKAKELLKEHVVSLSVRAAEKILRREIDGPAQRKLVAEFIDQVEAAAPSVAGKGA